MNFLCLHVSMILKLAHTAPASHVLVAGDEEAFRSFAKNFVPEKLANEIANLVSQTPEGYQDNKNEYYDANVNARAEQQMYGNRDYDHGQYEEQPEEPEEMEVPAEPEQIQPVNSYFPKSIRPEPKKPKTMQVNLDELVEKVRHRLLSELEGPEIPTTKPNPQMLTPKKKALAETEYAETKEMQPPSEAFKNFQVYTPKKILRTTSELPSVVVRPEIKNKPSNKPKDGTVESHDIFEKVKLAKPKGKKDSYEDYVMPKKEDDIFVSEEDSKKKTLYGEFSVDSEKQDKLKPRFQIQGKRLQSKNKMTTPNPYNQPMGEAIEQDTKNMDAEYANANNNENTRNRDTLQNVKPLKVASKNNGRVKHRGNNNDFNGYNRQTENINTAQVETTTKVEYIDDDYTGASTIEQELKAITGFIGGDDYEEPTGITVTQKSSSKSKKKKRPRRIATNMPTRKRYQFPTPNYYAKLPRIAEKYNFDEPIPDGDREQENLKPIGNPPANINGKAKLKV